MEFWPGPLHGSAMVREKCYLTKKMTGQKLDLESLLILDDNKVT